MELHDIVWKRNKKHLYNLIKDKCDEYKNNKKYKINKTYENNKLVGFCVYHDEKEYRFMDEVCYIGQNRYFALKMWRWAIKDAQKIRLIVQKWNKKLIEFYKKTGFKCIDYDEFNYLLER
jgi:ribosomal protein S18 acetylase RimI-like enzyme